MSIEILAPAGDMAALDAALTAGADAVYLGLRSLNARRGAANFTPEMLAVAVQKAHAAKARVYLTLNTDLAQRELNQALRALQLASDVGVDAVLVKDASLLPLIPEFPNLEFHFSTQAAICNSLGVKAAEGLGVKRCVLAREMTAAEIAATAGASEFVETEVFAQGAMCFSVSGRCLMSSWVGGRSGNRGCCASPCRVPWQAGNCEEECKPFSMHDLSLANHLAELEKMGVSSLKIEGRLKSAAWVSRAVTLFKNKNATDESLGDYTGRQQTDAYFIGDYDDLVGDSGRISTASQAVEEEEVGALPEFQLSITEEPDGRGHRFTAEFNGITESFRLPPRDIKKVKKAVPVAGLCEMLADEIPEDWAELILDCTVPEETLFVPTSARQAVDFLGAFVRKMRKPPDDTLRNPLPDNLKDFFVMTGGCEDNNRTLGMPVDRVRIDAKNALEFARVHPKLSLIVECRNVLEYKTLRGSIPDGTELIISLPSVLYETELPDALALLDFCVEEQNEHGDIVKVEVNGWDMVWAAFERQPPYVEAGPGLAVLNAAAAQTLWCRPCYVTCDCRSAFLSPEADRIQLETACEAAVTPLSLTVFGRPPLFISRVPMPQCADESTEFVDARGCRMTARREGSVTVYRPITPYSIANVVNDRIRVAHLVADLTASPDPLGEFAKLRSTAFPFRFNYDRTLR